MKRTLCLLFALAALLILAACATQEPPVGFAIGDDGLRAQNANVPVLDDPSLDWWPRILNLCESQDPQLAAELWGIVRDAKGAQRPDGLQILGSLTLEWPEQAAERYTLAMGEEQDFYLLGEDGLARMDTPRFLAFADQLGDSFYYYGALPQLFFPSAINGTGQGVPAWDHDYTYRKLDGTYAPVAEIEPPPVEQVVETDYIASVSLPCAGFPTGNGYTLVNTYDDCPVWVTDEEGRRSVGPLWESPRLDYEVKPGRPYQVELTLGYDNEHAKGEICYRYTVHTPQPEPEPLSFEMETMGAGDATDPGEIVILRIHNLPEGGKVGVDHDIPFSPTPSFLDDGAGGKYAMLPVSYYAEPRQYAIQLFAAGESQTFSLTVEDKAFEVQNLTVDSATTAATINSADANAEYNRIISPLIAVMDEERHWEGPFTLPIQNPDTEITTQFGAIRYTNGSTRATRHEAIDFDQETGDPITASGRGRVLYAGLLQLTGNTVLIEHGHGLKTWYYHMDSLEVETGDMVNQGQKIGAAGSTGFSTGPHLHFGMSVSGVFVNPFTAIQTDLLS